MCVRAFVRAFVRVCFVLAFFFSTSLLTLFCFSGRLRLLLLLLLLPPPPPCGVMRRLRLTNDVTYTVRQAGSQAPSIWNNIHTFALSLKLTRPFFSLSRFILLLFFSSFPCAAAVAVPSCFLRHFLFLQGVVRHHHITRALLLLFPLLSFPL